MRILIAAHGFPPTHSAGAERRAERMARWLTEQGHHVEVFAVESLSTPGFKVESGDQDGYQVHRLYYDIEDGDRFRKLYDNPEVGSAMRDLLAAQSFDLMHIVSGYLLGDQVIHAAREAGLPVIITLTEYWFLCLRLNLIQASGALCTGPESDVKCARCLTEDQRRYRLPAQVAPKLMDAFWSVAQNLPFAQANTQAIQQRRITLRDALNSANKVICPSRFLADKFAEFGFDTQHYVFMRQGLNIPAALPAPVPADGPLRLVYIGQIQAHKGVDLLVDAVIKLRDQGCPVTLDLWGAETQAPAYAADLKARSAAYESIRWNGRYTGPKVWEVLAAADALVIPSRWYENSPNVILEAYAMGLPVVGTNLGGMAELIEDEGSGLLFELNSVDDLARQLQRLSDEAGLLDRLKAGIAPPRSIEDEMHEVMTHYEDLIVQQSVP